MATALMFGGSFGRIDISVAEAGDCGAAQASARRMALALGFPASATEEIVLVVAELASNLLKHAGRGSLNLEKRERGDQFGIQIEASDRGPGISDVERSFTDGYSTTGSLGYGLGTVHRLMDEVDIRSTPGCGTHIVCCRWKRLEDQYSGNRLWDVGVFTRPRRQAAENGDAFVVKQWQSNLLVGLIDGLGHGEYAQKAALAAQQYVNGHYDQPLAAIFSGVNRACRATRGVVMALARFDSPVHFSFASVGNVEVRTWAGLERLPFTVKRGILGTQETQVNVQEFQWDPGWLLVLHTDGLHTHWQWSDFPGIEREPSQAAAARLMRQLATEADDATVLAVKTRPS